MPQEYRSANAEQFPYALLDREVQPPTEQEKVTDTLRRVHVFIRDQVVARRNGKLPNVKTIAVRLIVLQALLEPEGKHSLASDARELGCSRAWLSKVGIVFSESIGMRASWQRLDSRAAYSERAKGVHAGDWKVTPKWERALRSPTNKKSAAYRKGQAPADAGIGHTPR